MKEKVDIERTKKLRWASRSIIVATGLLWMVYDIFPAVNVGRGDTISENVRDWSRKWWILAYVWGALATHFFVNVGQPANYKSMFYVFAGVTVGYLATNIATVIVVGEVPPWFRLLALVIGALTSLVLWAQNP